MSLQAMIWAIEEPNLTPSEKLVLIGYADHSNELGICWPQQNTLADRLGLSRQTVNRATKKLEDKGVLKLEPRSGLGGRKSSKVTFTDFAQSNIWRHPKSQSETLLSIKNHPLNQPIGEPNVTSEPAPPKSTKSNPPQSLPHGEKFQAAWEMWESHRREKRKPLTPISIRLQLANLSKLSESEAVTMIEFSVENGYTGLFAPKVDQPKPRPTPSVLSVKCTPSVI